MNPRKSLMTNVPLTPAPLTPTPFTPEPRHSCRGQRTGYHIAIAALTLLAAAVARAADPADAEMQKDVILRAMVDELQRDHAGLKLEDLERPYFIEFGITDTGTAYAVAELGAIIAQNQQRGRSLRTDVRVGSYQLDNTNFGGGGYGEGGGGGADMPIEDDYTAIRQAIWWTSDRDYKGVVEELVQKKAFMEGKLIENKPDDWSHEPPAVYFEDRADLNLDPKPLQELATALSAIFREFPDIQSSRVTVSAVATNKYLVNTEGSRMRTAAVLYTLSASATVQADDGMKLSDSTMAYARKLAELPARDELIKRCREMAQQLIKVKSAPKLDSYTGPVLFDAEAAAAIFGAQFRGAFAGGQRPVGSRSNPDDFANKLNKRILPKFLSVEDDPSKTEIAGEPVLGHYVYDDQAVKAQTVQLIDHGRLKALLMSRNPSKEYSQSNGHGRGSYGASRAAVGCLVVTAQPATDAAGLKRELLEACNDEGLEYGIRIGALGSSGGRGGSGPLMMFKVFPDGHEEPVRGAEIARIDLKAFKHMLAAGDKPYVLNNASGSGDGQTLVVPAMLFEELDLAKIDRDFDKPPILPSPLARQ